MAAADVRVALRRAPADRARRGGGDATYLKQRLAPPERGGYVAGNSDVVRSAREGRLTVTDPYGRIVAETTSAALPGQRLTTTLAAGLVVLTRLSRP